MIQIIEKVTFFMNIGLNNTFMIITKRLRMEGFICSDWMPEWNKA